MSGPVFVDTNVLVYARDARHAAKQRKAHAWLASLSGSRLGRVSRQVLQEYYVTVTRKLKPGLPVAEAREDVRALLHWLPRIEPGALMEAAWSYQDRFSVSFWDALILGAAQCGRCRYVLSEDLSSGSEFEGILVVSPFQVAPSEIGIS